MIPDEAVEAAANAIGPVVKKLEALILARAALEASASILKADAWDEGYQSGKRVMVELMSPTHFATESDNPYRSQP